jgi:hypothetical protein
MRVEIISRIFNLMGKVGTEIATKKTFEFAARWERFVNDVTSNFLNSLK